MKAITQRSLSFLVLLIAVSTAASLVLNACGSGDEDSETTLPSKVSTDVM